jgi:hypothetical protein
MDIMMYQIGKLKVEERLSEASRKDTPATTLPSLMVVVRNLPLL